MKKNIRVNVSGILFNIDEDAYAKLENYLQRLEKHFSKSEGNKEIIEDIESGIADMMTSKLGEMKTIITLADIEEIIKTMGEPYEIDEETEENKSQEKTFNSYSMNQKRLYRDEDDRVIAGVCSGLSHYLNIDVAWIRILFVILLVISRNGFLIYIILWIAVPEANTTAQKLDMKGESINIDNIERKIRDEFNNLGDQLNNLKNKHFSKKKDIGKPIREIGNAFGRIIYTVGKVFLTIIGAIFAVIALLILIMLVPAFLFQTGALFNVFSGIVYFSIPEIARSITYNPTDYNIIIYSLLAIAIIPLISILIGGLGYLFNFRTEAKGVKKAFGVIWVVALLLLIYSGLKVGDSFERKAQISEEIPLMKNSQSDTLYLKINPKLMEYPIFEEEVSQVYNAFDNSFLLYKEDSLFYSIPEIETYATDDSIVTLKITKYSRGNKKRIATQNANHINYKYYKKDSLLEIAPIYTFPSKDSWRNQRVKIKIYMPHGKYFKLINNQNIKKELFKDIESEIKYNH